VKAVKLIGVELSKPRARAEYVALDEQGLDRGRERRL
jgi:hypothetical protein